MFVCCECCVLSGRGLCDQLITRPEESYRLLCVSVCDLENLKNEEAIARHWAASAIKNPFFYKGYKKYKHKNPVPVSPSME